jgi:hypothetical protein
MARVQSVAVNLPPGDELFDVKAHAPFLLGWRSDQ